MTLPEPSHLGDGVYASFNGFHLNIAVNDHRNHAVALEPEVLGALIDYARRINVLSGQPHLFPVPGPAEPTADPFDGRYVVWSNEHKAWWRAGRNGYTTLAEMAGIYSRDVAFAIARDARGGWRPGENPNEIAIPARDALLAIGGPVHESAS